MNFKVVSAIILMASLAILIPAISTASAATPVTYSSDKVYIAKIITRHMSDGNYKSWIVVHASDNTEVNHLAIRISNQAKLVSVQNIKNWQVWHDPYTIDLHALGTVIGHNGLVIRATTDIPPTAEVLTAMHH